MTESKLTDTAVKISSDKDKCLRAKIEQRKEVRIGTASFSAATAQLRTNGAQKEVCVRITAKNKPLNMTDVSTL